MEKFSFTQARVMDVIGSDGIRSMVGTITGSLKPTVFDVPIGRIGELSGVGYEASLAGSSLGASMLQREIEEGNVVEERSAGKASVGVARSVDPEHRRAIEQHAVRLATAYMEADGWSVRELGKPFDLVCTKSDGSEKHVEVKGATGAAASVEYTPNEVAHFRNCPSGADLIVVKDINIDKKSYATSGGTLLHIENYSAPQEDLSPAKWLGKVTWPSS